MLKCFIDTPEFPGKYNFVDDRNVVLGYSAGQNCCETFGYYFTTDRKIEENAKKYLDTLKEQHNEEFLATPSEEALKVLRFDKKWFKEFSVDGYECGNCFAVRLKAKGVKTHYLVLYNYHNGYYSHGFDFTKKKGGKEIVIASGSL